MLVEALWTIQELVEKERSRRTFGIDDTIEKK